MIPYRDDNPSQSLPVVTIALIALNGWVFALELRAGSMGLARMFYEYGVVPVQVLHPETLDGVRAAGISLVTSMFLHAGLWHFAGNMWFLWLFGDNVEDRLGSFRFLVFYLLCGVAAAGAHVALNANARVPCVGASGAIAGVLGAYVLMFPRARVRAIIPIFIVLPLFVTMPAVFFIGCWFAIQLLNGMATVGAQGVATGTAWWAHIGGFVAGMFFAGQFASSRRRRTRRVPVRRF